MNRNEFLRQLEAFGLPKKEYMIRSGGSLLMRGLREETADFDLCVSEELAQKLGLEHCPKDRAGCYIPFENVQMKPDLGAFPFDVIDGYQCESLESILALKRKLLRPKDLRDIAVIEAFLEDAGLSREERILKACKKETSRNPLEIFFHIAQKDFVNIHGPEHHVLDGACVLTAFHNAGGNIDLDSALETMLQRGAKMPGATCGHWGVCGAVMSIGAALSVIDKTGPLSTDDSWGSHMLYTSGALRELAVVGGPRCCKRDAFLAMKAVIPYIRDRYQIALEDSDVECVFSPRNQQCIHEKCPFYKPNAV